MTRHADLDLARRLEDAASVISAEAASNQTSIEPAVLPVGGGRAVLADVGGVLSEAKALGMHGPVSDDDLERMEHFFFSRGTDAKVVVCPMADASLRSGLAKRGHALVEFESMLVRPLDDPSDRPAPSR